jgi:hypothetical protein
MRICSDEKKLSEFYDQIIKLKNDGCTKEEIGFKLAYDAFKEGVANFQLKNLIDTAFLEK